MSLNRRKIQMTTKKSAVISTGNYRCYQSYHCLVRECIDKKLRSKESQPNSTAVTPRKERRTSNFAQVETDRKCGQLYTYIYKAVQSESKLRHDETRSAAARPQCHLCYRPTVFLLHLRHIALPAPVQGNIRSAFKNAIISSLFKNGIKFEIAQI